MHPNDFRHGTEAGHEQHRRDGEDPCQPCLDAKLKAARRRTKRKTQGHRYTLPAGAAWDRVQRWRDGGASLDDIASITGLEESVTSRIINGQRTMPIYARTFHAIMRAPAGMPLTSIGATRRIQALQRLGWSVERIAIEAGVHRDTILDGRQPRVFVARRVRVSIDGAYRRLHMVIPTGETKQHRAGITRARNHAERMGWLPPLAWTDIDDALEHPDLTSADNAPDPVVVERILAGDWRLKANPAERREVIARWPGTLNELERRTGWNVARIKREAVA